MDVLEPIAARAGFVDFQHHVFAQSDAIARLHCVDIDPAHDDLRRLRDLEVDSLRRIDANRMGEAERELERLAAQLRAIPHALDLELMMASAVLTVVPVLTLFFVLQKQYIAGMMAGSVKG